MNHPLSKVDGGPPGEEPIDPYKYINILFKQTDGQNVLKSYECKLYEKVLKFHDVPLLTHVEELVKSHNVNTEWWATYIKKGYILNCGTLKESVINKIAEKIAADEKVTTSKEDKTIYATTEWNNHIKKLTQLKSTGDGIELPELIATLDTSDSVYAIDSTDRFYRSSQYSSEEAIPIKKALQAHTYTEVILNKDKKYEYIEDSTLFKSTSKYMMSTIYNIPIETMLSGIKANYRDDTIIKEYIQHISEFNVGIKDALCIELIFKDDWNIPLIDIENKFLLINDEGMLVYFAIDKSKQPNNPILTGDDKKPYEYNDDYYNNYSHTFIYYDYRPHHIHGTPYKDNLYLFGSNIDKIYDILATQKQ